MRRNEVSTTCVSRRVQANLNRSRCVMAKLLTSGFQAQSTNRASVQLDQPQSLSIKNGTAGQLVARITPVRNTNMYEGRIKASDGDCLPSNYTGDSQHIIFDGLTNRSTSSLMG